MNQLNHRVVRAIDITLTGGQILQDHMKKTLVQRNPSRQSSGSTFESTQTWDSIGGLEWQIETDPKLIEYTLNRCPPDQRPMHGQITGLLRTQLDGYLGVYELEMLHPDRILTMLDGHNTGEVQPTLILGTDDPEPTTTVSKTDFCSLLLEWDDTLDSEIVSSIFPGGPVPTVLLKCGSTHQIDGNPVVLNAGMNLTRRQVQQLGFKYYKTKREPKPTNSPVAQQDPNFTVCVRGRIDVNGVDYPASAYVHVFANSPDEAEQKATEKANLDKNQIWYAQIFGSQISKFVDGPAVYDNNDVIPATGATISFHERQVRSLPMSDRRA